MTISRTRERKEGLEPKIKLLEFNMWPVDAFSETGHEEVGFGVTGFFWYAHRRRWWIDGTYKHLTELRGDVRVIRPRWKKETVECWKMLHLDIQVWSQILNVAIRLRKVKWEPSTTYS